MDEKSQCSVFIMKSVVCVQFIAESLVNLDKRNTNKGIALHKKNFDHSYILLHIIHKLYTKISNWKVVIKKREKKHIKYQKLSFPFP